MSPIWAVLPLCALLKLARDDLRHRRLANAWVLAYVLMFPPYAWLAGFEGGLWGAHALVGGVAFLVLLGLFALGAMGGGDVKLGAALWLWAGPAYALPLVVVVAWTGGLLAVTGWLADRLLPDCQDDGWMSRLGRALSARRGVPYGVALAGGGIWLLWRQYLGVL